jgi:drug/metabolite transporter (DMT)-like permease
MPSRADHHARLAYLMLIACTVLWGSNITVGRAVHADIPPVALAFWRNTVALLALLPFTWRELRAQWPLVKANLGLFAGAGVIGTALFNAALYQAVHTTTVINAALVMSLTPVVVPIMAFLLLRDRLSGRQAGGIAVSFAGVVVVIARGEWSVLTSLAVRPGDLLMLLAMLAWSFYSVLVKRKPAALGPFAFLAAILACAAPVLLPFYVAESILAGPMPFTPLTVAAAGYVGLFPTALALLLYNRAVQAIGPNRAGAFNHLTPVFAALLAILFLGERFAIYHLAGGALIVAGLYLASAERRGR